MIEVMDRDYFDNVQKFAKDAGKYEQLWEQLNYLDGYACWVGDKIKDNRLTRCKLFKDFAPYSFYFLMERLDVKTGEYRTWFNGGLIYFGQGEDGVGLPQLSVRMNSERSGWEIHT